MRRWKDGVGRGGVGGGVPVPVGQGAQEEYVSMSEEPRMSCIPPVWSLEDVSGDMSLGEGDLL